MPRVCTSCHYLQLGSTAGHSHHRTQPGVSGEWGWAADSLAWWWTGCHSTHQQRLSLPYRHHGSCRACAMRHHLRGCCAESHLSILRGCISVLRCVCTSFNFAALLANCVYPVCTATTHTYWKTITQDVDTSDARWNLLQPFSMALAEFAFCWKLQFQAEVLHALITEEHLESDIKHFYVYFLFIWTLPGTTRDNFEGKKALHLEYECYCLRDG